MKEIRNLINITDLTVEEIDELIAVADDIVENHAEYEDICAHKKLATLFFERADCCSATHDGSDYQRRRRRTFPPDTDFDRPFDD